MDTHQDCPYRISALATAFPPLPPADYARLRDSIEARGLRTPIVVWRGEIIDGFHRLRACIETGVAPTYRFLGDDEDPVAFVVDVNMPFRNMSQNQKAQAAYLMSQFSTPGRPRSAQENSANLRNNITQGEAAALVGVSPRLVSDASRVLSSASAAVPAVQEAVREWRVKASDAARVVGHPPEVQQRAMVLVDRGETKTIKGAVKRVEEEMMKAEQATALEEMLARPLPDTLALHTASVACLRGRVDPGTVDCIITHPPHIEEALPLLADLASFAAHALKPSGVMVVVGSGVLLPQMLERLTHPELRWLAEFDLVFRGAPVGSGPPHYMKLRRRPVLVYHKGQFRVSGMPDLLELSPEDALPKGTTEQEAAMELLVKQFCRPGQKVCDPVMLDRAGVALAARRLGCTFVGASEVQSCVDRIRRRLDLAEKEREDLLADDSGKEESLAVPRVSDSGMS